VRLVRRSHGRPNGHRDHGQTLFSNSGETGAAIFPVDRGKDSRQQSAGIVEWDSLDDAVAFYKSKAWTDLAPQRDNAVKAERRYVVEVEK
jgi:uncharacterized protein (DUF1330 family)